MKKLFIFFLCCFLVKNNLSQNASVKFGPELIKPRKTEIKELLGSDATSFYCIRSQSYFFGKDDIYLEKYSKSKLTIDYFRPFRLPEVNGNTLRFEKSILLNDVILIFSSYYDRSLDKHLLYLNRISTTDGAKIDKLKEIDYISAERKSNQGSFDFVVSNDGSKILILHNEPYEKYENQKFSYKLIDAEGNALWSAAFELPYRDKYFTLNDYSIDNDGKIFMLAKITKEKAERERKKPTYTYDLISYDYTSNSLKETPVNLGDKYISDISFVLAPDDKIIVAGFYSDKTREGIEGTFYLTIDKIDQYKINSAESDFSDDFMSEFMSERKAKKNKELYNYKIDHIILKNDGSIYIIAEQYFINVVTTCQPRGGCTTTYYYNYNNIIVVNFNADASVKWVKQIPKTQISANDFGYYSSYALKVKDDKLYFLYNDHPKNFTKPRKYPRNAISRRMVTVMATIDPDGKLERNTLFNFKQEKTFTRPKISASLSADQSLFYAIKRKKYKFGIITYP